jgi:hypothetical protein
MHALRKALIPILLSQQYVVTQLEVEGALPMNSCVVSGHIGEAENLADPRLHART